MAYELIDDEDTAPEQKAKAKYSLVEEDDQQPVEMPGTAQGLAQQAVQGLTLGWGDEAADVLGIQPKERFRTQEKMFREENPWTSTAVQIGGGLAPMLFPATRKMAFETILGRMPAFAGAARNLALPATVGGVYGAISGAGDAESFEDILPKTAQGAAIGILATPAMQLGAKLIGGAGSSIWEGAKSLVGVKTPGKGGVDLLAKAMKEEGIDPNVIRQQVEERTKATGKPVMWLDMIDPNKHPKTYDLMSKGLIEGTSAAPKMKVIERGDDTTARLVGDVQKHVHKRGEMSYDDLMKSRVARSNEWKAAFDPIKGVPVDSKEVMEVLSRPFAMEAIGTAIRTAKDRGDKNASSMLANFLSNDPQTGKFVWRKAPTLELIQTIKNLGYTPALKSVYEGKPIGTDTGTILQQQKDLLRAVDAAVPEYAGIRKRFADSADIDNARELGANLQRVLNRGVEGVGGDIKGLKSEQVIAEFKEMGKAEKDAFLQGLAASMTGNVRAKAASEGAAKYSAIVGEPSAKESAKIKQLQAIFGNTKRLRTFLDKLETEKTIEKTTKEFTKRKGATFDEPASRVARDVVRIGGAAALGRLASAIPGIGSQVGSFVAGQSPRLMQPVGEIAAQRAGEAAPMLERLGSQYGREMGQMTTADIFNPYLLSVIGENVGENFKKGGLARYCSCQHK